MTAPRRRPGRPSKFTPEKDEIVRAEYPNVVDTNDLAARLGVNLVQLHNRAMELGVRRRRKAPNPTPQPTLDVVRSALRAMPDLQRVWRSPAA